jgi:hypothetical protein
MRLTFEPFDGRRWNHRPIIDQDTGKEVGYLRSEGTGFEGFGGIHVSLFDGRYKRTLHRFEECSGFVWGVEAVLNHMIADRPAQALDSTAA